MSSFKDLGLSDPILKVLGEIGFENPTPIQESTIPVLSENETDFIGLAQTGTGKTAAFGLPLLMKVDLSIRKTQALILAPTRELGRQIGEQLETFSKYYPKASIQTVYGGTNISQQIRELKNTPQILIATPGRLIDLINRKAVKINEINYVVLDEADEMLNMGFKEDIDKILEFTPDEKRTWLFSATMPKEIKRIVNSYMDDPEEISIDREKIVNTNIEHQYVVVDGRRKNEALMRFIDVQEDMRGIIFCRTRRGTQNLADVLMQNGYQADSLHGDLSQTQRDRVMNKFKASRLQVLVATDVAARGIDVNDLTHVFHHALPDDLPYYTHRSGRTARAGKKGTSIAFVSKGEVRKLKMIERSLKLKFKQVDPPSVEEILGQRMVLWAEQKAGLKLKLDKSVSDDLMESILAYFDEYSKEEIIMKFAIQEMQRLNVKKKVLGSSEGRRDGDGRERKSRDRGRGRDRDRRGGSDRRDRGRNSRDRGRDRDNRGRDNGRSDRRDRSDRGSRDRDSRNSDGVRFFINMGRVDGFNKRDLVEFVSKYGDVNQRSIDGITIGDKFSFFNIDKNSTGNAARKIDGMDVKGRKIRMNRDDD